MHIFGHKDQQSQSEIIYQFINNCGGIRNETPYILACVHSDKITITRLIDYCHCNLTIKDNNNKFGSSYCHYSPNLRKYLSKQEEEYKPVRHEKPSEEEDEDQDVENNENKPK